MGSALACIYCDIEIKLMDRIKIRRRERRFIAMFAVKLLCGLAEPQTGERKAWGSLKLIATAAA